MIPRAASKPLVVAIAASLVFGTTFLALAQRWSATVTRVCVKPNGLVRVVTDRNPACTAREQPLDWVVGGEVTDIAVGEGLVESRLEGRVELALDPSLLEACTACRGGGVFAGFNDGPGTIPPQADETLAELDLPAGSYAIFAKITLQNTDDVPTFDTNEVRCRLAAEADFDEAASTIERAHTGLDDPADTLGLQVVHHFPVPGSVILTCNAVDLFDEVIYRDLKITAIEVSRISNVILDVP
jgi:hypothetical protein